MEYDGPVWSRIQPYGGLALAPTLALAGQSELEGSVSALGLPLELTAGAFVHTGWEVLGFDDASFGLGGQYLLGSVDDSKLNGFGAQVFVRFGL